MTNIPPPQSSPEACLEVAFVHQEAYERIYREVGHMPLGSSRREPLFYHGAMSENNALLAIAGFLNQMHVCDHGTRGWCPYCASAIVNNGGQL